MTLTFFGCRIQTQHATKLSTVERIRPKKKKIYILIIFGATYGGGLVVCGRLIWHSVILESSCYLNIVHRARTLQMINGRAKKEKKIIIEEKEILGSLTHLGNELRRQPTRFTLPQTVAVSCLNLADL